MTERQSQHDDSADALRSMAEASAADAPAQGQPGPAEQPEASDALAAMADGLDLSPPEPSADGAADPAPAAGAEVGCLPEGGVPVSARRSRAAGLKSQEGKARTQQFKRFMIPLLLAVGLMLLALGGIAAILMPAGGSGEEPSGGSLKWAVLAAFPLGAALLFGAWFFHRELKQTQRK